MDDFINNIAPLFGDEDNVEQESQAVIPMPPHQLELSDDDLQ